MAKKEIGMAVSGGGFRATLFHLGAFWRMNEMGYLKQVDRICSVSGGSITTAMLGLKWKKLAFDQQGVATNFSFKTTHLNANVQCRTLHCKKEPTHEGGTP